MLKQIHASGNAIGEDRTPQVSCENGKAAVCSNIGEIRLDIAPVLKSIDGKQTYVRNPAHPEVFQWYQDYLDAMIRAFGPVADGFVWDETFHVYAGTITQVPQPAYCDRAMFRLVKKLTERVEKYDPQKVFLASDSPRANRVIPGYAMVADGTYQDSGCWMGAWQFGLFPNWRNTLWSCNWGSLSRFPKTKASVERYGVPVAISNGWTDDRGPSEWSDAEKEKILKLFKQRLAMKERVRYIPEEPAKKPSDPPSIDDGKIAQ